MTITENNCKTIFGKLDAMQKWVIAGMGAVILQLVLLLMEIFKAKVA
ncbi:hypothetical protein KJ865_13000 [Myxococcota bacterium]|nr:hypothetical protein [Myxococcota bacterium]